MIASPESMNETNAERVTTHWRLCNADSTLRLFITTFLILLTSGYAIGLLFVDHTTSGTPRGLAEQYRGSPENTAEIKYAKSIDEMYMFLHNHVLSLSLVFFTVGGLFYFSSIVGHAVKKFLMVEPIIAIATTFGGIWLMRFVSELFSWLVIISGVTMVGCFLIMITLILWELWRVQR
ncbi:MAG: hypothetical protein HYR76_12035 [Ignavibacteria bacterium]|nr:hypothetical protein [Ignavibacteria bacterium]MBI3766605.1 hypothetical protein [Ignavibacteriales bacterium]